MIFSSKDGAVSIYESTDNSSWTKLAEAADEASYKYEIIEDFLVKYIKAKQETESGTIESEPFIAMYSEGGYICTWPDSDSDTLTDWSEANVELLHWQTDGGWWVKNVRDKAYYWDESTETTSSSYANIVIETNYENITPQTAACFLYYYPLYNGYYGHIVFIEAIEYTDTDVYVYYSDTWVGKKTTQGAINKKTLQQFVSMYDNKKPLEYDTGVKEPIFQGYIKVVT